MTNEKLEKILIADDNESYRNYLAKKLSEEFQCQIDYAQTVSEEIQKAKTNSYNLIITDYDMQEDRNHPEIRNHGLILYPEQTGLYAIKRIRQFDNKTPIILNSYKSGAIIAIEALQEGADQTIDKRISWDKYKKIIEEYLTNINERRYE